MSGVSLKAADESVICALNRAHVESTLGGLKKYLKRSIWIGTTNHYNRNVIGRLKTPTPSTITHKRNLAQYITASITLHANDGWSYLGRAASALLSGDPHRALHLAYYAELRAAMSLLAGVGIGVFNTDHFVISSPDTTTRLRTRLGTHLMAWLALKEWTKSRGSGVLFAKVVQPEGLTLEEWFQPIGGATAIAPQAKAWFKQWGMDLSLATRDRHARNESSYRPDGVPKLWNPNTKDSIDFIRDMWNSLEPNSISGFDNIDRHILRIAIRGYHKGRFGRAAAASDPQFVALIDKLITAQNFQGDRALHLKRFLVGEISVEVPQIFLYSASKPRNEPADAMAVMARAVLLLRLATGAAKNMMGRVGIKADALSFWWTGIGETRGLWPSDSPPEELSDLWADIADTLMHVADIEASDPMGLDSLSTINQQMPSQLSVLASHERVALWGLCPS